VQQQRELAAGFGVAHEEQFAAVGGGHADIEHLQRGKFLEHGTRHQATAESSQFLPQRNGQNG